MIPEWIIGIAVCILALLIVTTCVLIGLLLVLAFKQVIKQIREEC